MTAIEKKQWVEPPISEEEMELFEVFVGKRVEKGKTIPNIEQATQRLRQGEISEEFKEFSQVLEVKRELDTKGLSFIVESLTQKGFDREEVELHIYCRQSRDHIEDHLGGYLIHWGADLEQKIRWAKTDRGGVKIYEEEFQSLKAEKRLQNQLKDAWREGNLEPVEHHLLHKQERALETLTPLDSFVAHFLPREAEEGKIRFATEGYIDAGIEYLLTKQLLKEVKREKGREKE